MALKSRDQLSVAYRRRLERAEAKGLSRQEARGHRAGEHIVRRLGGAKQLTATQRHDAELLAKAVKGKRGASRAAAAAEANRKAANREKARERHRRQVEREKWSGQLTDKDKRYARMIGRAWRSKLTPDNHPLIPVEQAERMGLERMQRIGPEAFRAAVRVNRAAYRQYIKQIEDETYESLGPSLLDIWAEPDGEPITMWYYYHSYS